MNSTLECPNSERLLGLITWPHFVKRFWIHSQSKWVFSQICRLSNSISQVLGSKRRTCHSNVLIMSYLYSAHCPSLFRSFQSLFQSSIVSPFLSCLGSFAVSSSASRSRLLSRSWRRERIGQVVEDHAFMQQIFIEHLLPTTHFTVDHSEQNRKNISVLGYLYSNGGRKTINQIK